MAWYGGWNTYNSLEGRDTVQYVGLSRCKEFVGGTQYLLGGKIIYSPPEGKEILAIIVELKTFVSLISYIQLVCCLHAV